MSEPPPPAGPELDPEDWSAFRAQAHRMLDDMVDYVAGIRARPVWAPVPEATAIALREPLPAGGEPLEAVHAQFMEHMQHAGGLVSAGP